MKIRFDHLVIAAGDPERTDRFYRRVFDAEIMTVDKIADISALSPEERRSALQSFRAYRIADVQLNVHGPGLNAPASLLAAQPVRPGNSDFCFEWIGPIGDAVAHLERCGVAIETGPRESGGSKGRGTSVYFRDPDGALLEFIAYAGHHLEPAKEA